MARYDIALERRRDGQGGALRREQRIVGAVGARQRAVESVIGDRAEITADFGVVIAHARVDRETILPVTEVELDAANPRDARIANLAETVEAEEGELDVVPVLLIDRAVETHRPPTRLPPEFKIGRAHV